MIEAVRPEVAQKRVAGTERQETEARPRRSLFAQRHRKQAVHDLMGGTVATHGDESAHPTLITGTREFLGMAGRSCPLLFDLKPSTTQTSQQRGRELTATPAAGGGIDDCEQAVGH